MKAIQAADRGGYDALRLVDIPRPRPRAGQALVRVTAAGVTPLDRTVLAGLHPRAAAPPLVPGNEGAGVVIEDPSGHFSAGERVLFFAGPVASPRTEPSPRLPRFRAETWRRCPPRFRMRSPAACRWPT
jgi:NADPH:quinone reductase-like Zn-dependent oxidoreductase